MEVSGRSAYTETNRILLEKEEAEHLNKLRAFVSGCQVGDVRLIAFNDAQRFQFGLINRTVLLNQLEHDMSEVKDMSEVEYMSALRIHEVTFGIVEEEISRKKAEIPNYYQLHLEAVRLVSGYSGFLDRAEALSPDYNISQFSPKIHDIMVPIFGSILKR